MHSHVRKMKGTFKIIIFLFSILTVNITSAQQTEIKGRITDSKSGEAMVGVHISLKDAVHGTISGSDGTFMLRTGIQPPWEYVFRYVGYVPMDIVVTNTSVPLDIRMEEQFLLGQEVVVSASRIEENILRSAVSIEKMNLRDLKLISTANFYDGLYQLKGVDMNVHGLTFSLPNTRDSMITQITG